MKSLGKKPTGARLERMQESPLWAGEGFRNIHPILPGLRDLTGPRVTLSEFLCGGSKRRVPRGPLPSSNPLAVWAKPPDTGLRATWLGHSTVLIEIDGLRVLTDPVWGPRASPSTLAGPKRFQPVPVALSALPPIDLVLVSHDHYDHLDYRRSANWRACRCPSSPRSAWARTSKPGGLRPSASPCWTGGNRTRCTAPMARAN